MAQAETHLHVAEAPRSVAVASAARPASPILRFDRGTLVVERAPPGLRVGTMPGMRWDPRVRTYRAPASAYAELRAALVAAGAPLEDRVGREVRGRAPEGWRAPELRSYQQAALASWELAGRRGTVVLPTGSGKTRTAIAGLAAAGCAGLCLVPTRVLLDQWVREIGQHVAGAVGRLGDGDQIERPITVATYASVERLMARLGGRFGMVVVDEAHHATAGALADVLQLCIAPYRLGLTATPPSDDAGVAQLSATIGPVCYELAVGDLAGTFLAPFDLVTLRLDLSARERERYEQEMRVFRPVFIRHRTDDPDGTWGDFLRAASRSDEGRRGVAAWRRARALLAYTEAKRAALAELLTRNAGARILVFTSNTEVAYRIAREHLIMPITAAIGRKERERALARFESGELRALVSARVLNEGVDVPDADVAIVVGGSRGAREHTQRIGRVLRPAPGKSAVVYELVTRDTTEVGQAHRRRAALAARVASQR